MTTLMLEQSLIDCATARDEASPLVGVSRGPAVSDCAMCNSLLALAKAAVNALASGINSEIHAQLGMIRSLPNRERVLLSAYARFRAEFFRETFQDALASRWRWLEREASAAVSG